MTNTDPKRIVTVITTLVARARWDGTDVANYMHLDHAHRQELMRNLFQRAKETSGTQQEDEATFAIRRNALEFAARVVDAIDSKVLNGGTEFGRDISGEDNPQLDKQKPLPADQEAGARWFFATLARRWMENDLLQRGLSFGDRNSVLSAASGIKPSAALQKMLLQPAEAVRHQLGILKGLQGVEVPTQMDIAYEGAYMEQMLGNYEGAMKVYADCSNVMTERGDSLSAKVYWLQRAKTAMDANIKGVTVSVKLPEVFEVYAGAIPVLEAGHDAGNKIATQWLQETIPAHLSLLAKHDATWQSEVDRVTLLSKQAGMDMAQS